VSLCVNTVCLLSVVMVLFMPAMAERLQEQLNVDGKTLPVLGQTFR
jgi:hypothetical protein